MKVGMEWIPQFRHGTTTARTEREENLKILDRPTTDVGERILSKGTQPLRIVVEEVLEQKTHGIN